MNKRHGDPIHAGFTLVEVSVALFIVAVLVGLLVPLASSVLESQRANQTTSELQTYYTAIVGNPQQGTYGYLGDVGDYPSSLTDLISSSATGWNGPYITNSRIEGGVLLDPFGGAVEYVAVASSGVSDYLTLVSKGPDRTSTNPNQNSNAKSAFTAATYPWSGGYGGNIYNTDNILFPNIVDSPGQASYQSLGTLSYNIYNFDTSANVNANVPGCPALYQLTITSVPRGTADQFTLMYNPGGVSVDLTQGLYTVNIKSMITNATVFTEQVAVQPGGSNSRTVNLTGLDSSQTPTFNLTVNNQSGGAVDIYNFKTKIGATLASGATNTFAINACAPVLIRRDVAGSGTTILDALTMPYKAYTRRVDNPNGVNDVVVTDTGVTNPNTLLKVYEGGTSASTGLLVGTITFKGNKKVKRFFNVKVNHFLTFENQAGTFIATFQLVTAAPVPNTKNIP
jgi:prepilin-type N-terminal cleavage/methylation domain-containing protein